MRAKKNKAKSPPLFDVALDYEIIVYYTKKTSVFDGAKTKVYMPGEERTSLVSRTNKQATIEDAIDCVRLMYAKNFIGYRKEIWIWFDELLLIHADNVNGTYYDYRKEK